MSVFDRFKALKPAPVIEVRSAADYLRIPQGFFLVQRDGSEQLAHNDLSLGIRWNVPEAFSEGGMFFRLTQERREMPLVRLIFRQPLPPGVAIVNGCTVIDTEQLSREQV